MLCLSQGVGYAVRALSCLDLRGGGSYYFVAEIAERAHVPPAYLAKIFKKLADAGIIESRRGPGGGNRLARPATAITLMDIAIAVDGPNWIGNCLFGPESCFNDDRCPSHGFWMAEKLRIESHLRSTSLEKVTGFTAGGAVRKP